MASARSIRTTLLGWYGLILMAVLLVFGALLYRRAAEAMLSQHDALIESRANALAGGISYEATDGWELELSDDYLRAVAETTYFAIWDGGGKLFRAGGVAEVPPLPTALGRRQRGDLREHIARSRHGATVLVGLSQAADRARLRGLISSIVGGGLAVLVLAGAGGAWLARRSAFARLEEAFARQTRFTADASHELRTPVSILRTQIELALSRARAPGEYRETLEICLRSVQRMSSLVDGLLTLARADGSTDGLTRERVPLETVVRAAAETVRPAAAERGVSLHLDLGPAVVEGDPERLADVATNLLSNAVRYNRTGGRVEVALAGQADGGVELIVADTGIGIPAEARGKIFDRFFRVDAARSRAAGGAGLGLAITKWIVEAHGGRIQVEDNPGGGSVFRVRLPAVGSGLKV
jgi:signal transduction histidine kinase